jgi:hypothetical protein
MNAHRHPMRADADLSLPGSPRLAAELLDRLDLNDVTLVGNEHRLRPVQLLAGGGAAGIGRVVLILWEAFDKFPPGLTGVGSHPRPLLLRELDVASANAAYAASPAIRPARPEALLRTVDGSLLASSAPKASYRTEGGTTS